MMRIAVIARRPNDFTEALSRVPSVQAALIAPGELLSHNLDDYDSILILGGTEEQPLTFPAFERMRIEEQINAGKRVFCEYCASISSVYFLGPASTRFLRLVHTGRGLPVPGVGRGAMLEDQCNTYLPPFLASGAARPMLLYKQAVRDHRRARLGKKDFADKSRWAMWFERDNLLLCMFRICNFNRARMAPIGQWRSLVSSILAWVCKTDASPAVGGLPWPYRPAGWKEDEAFEAQARERAERAVRWFENAGMLVREGVRGVEEGLSTEVLPDGEHRRLRTVRTDCTGEASMMYLMHFLLTGDRESLARSDNLLDFCFTAMQVKEGPHRGMLRWTETAWETCYQDDAARVLLPALLRALYTGDGSRLGECVDALRYLVSTTGTDGTRVMRTDNALLGPDGMEKLRSVPGNLPSAHYNAFYAGALLLCHKLTGIEEFMEVGLRCLGTIMAAYPDTAREQSETEELCRLVMPLAFAYWVTGGEEQRGWLYRVAEDLQRFRHPSGGYLEWDTGYRAACSHTKGGESSLLGRNGDPVVDMLYSLNWLPVGFMQAWFVTSDDLYLDLWTDIVRFFSSVQIESADARIHGAWTRGFDVELMEVYGSPNDVGWGPWAVESGWTVAEIASGMMMGMMRDRLSPCYNSR